MNTVHPVEAWLLRRTTVRRHLIDAFLEDRHLSPSERAVLDMIAMEDEEIAEYRAREVAADSFKRNGNTRITRDRFRDAGHDLVVLADERRERRSNVVEFPAHRDMGA